MNYQESSMDGQQLAELEYLDGEFAIIKPGGYVLCEVTGQRIPVEELRYWSVARQEAYVNAAAVDKRRQQIESGEA